MYTDLYTRIATTKSLTAASPTTITDTIDLKNAMDIGQGEELYFVFTITTAFSATGACYFQVGYADSASPTDATGFYPFTQTVFFAQADLVAGTQIVCRFNPITAVSTQSGYATALTGRRWIAGRVVATNGAANVGAFTLDIVTNIQGAKQAYPVGFSFVAGA